MTVLRIERARGEDGRVFRLTGTLDDATTRQLERAVLGPAGDGGDLTLELGELVGCARAAIDSLSMLARRAQLAGARLVLVAPGPEMSDALRMADLGDAIALSDGSPSLGAGGAT